MKKDTIFSISKVGEIFEEGMLFLSSPANLLQVIWRMILESYEKYHFYPDDDLLEKLETKYEWIMEV